MELTAREALDRTALLINGDCFDGQLTCDDIVDGLLSTTVRVSADRASLESAAGQTALVTFVSLSVMMGVSVDLDIPEIAVVGNQPPLVGDELRAALIDLGRSSVPGVTIGIDLGNSHAAFAIGSVGCELPANTIVVCGDERRARVAPVAAVRPWVWRADWPIGALAAGSLAAGEVFRVALARVAARAGRAYPAQCPPPGIVDLDLELGPHPSAAIDLGDVDLVSAGAITNGVLFSLLRVPRVTGRLRVYDDDVAETSNLNRYGLLRRRDLGMAKASLLQQFATPSLEIKGVNERFDQEAAARYGFAPRILVGADDIPTRWVVQRLAPDWLCVGATSHFFALVSNHTPNVPCVGCVHPHDDPFPGGRIPTVSVVSFFAGLLAATELLRVAAGSPRFGAATACFPVGLVETRTHRGIHSYLAPAHQTCPVGCAASASATKLAIDPAP